MILQIYVHRTVFLQYYVKRDVDLLLANTRPFTAKSVRAP